MAIETAMLMSTCSPTVRNSRGKSYLSFIEKTKGNVYLPRRKSVMWKLKFLLIKLLFRTLMSMYNVFAAWLGVDSSWFMPVLSMSTARVFLVL